MKCPNYTQAELEQSVVTTDEVVVFHGTSTCFSEQIEAKGWPLGGRPYSWDDIDYVSNLAAELNQTSGEWVGLGLRGRPPGASFTPQLNRAIQYACQCPGGENLSSGIDVAGRLVRHLRVGPTHPADLRRLEEIHATWSRLVEGAAPVVYAIRPSRESFPLFLKHCSVRIGPYGGITHLESEYNSEADVPASAIHGRIVLTRPLEWT